MNKKIINTGYYWHCENLDLLSPIDEQGIAVLFDDNSKEYFADGNEFNLSNFERASESEQKEFYKKRGYIFPLDKVKIVKGKKFVGQIKTVKSFFTFVVPNTYGHKYTDYVVFTDGTKVNIRHITPIVDLFKNAYIQSYENIELLQIGGRR